MVTDYLNIIQIEESYYEFVRLLRTDPRTCNGFIEQVSISLEQQKSYMSKYCNNYYICLYKDLPVGYFGIIDNDIRYCVVPYYNNLGIGTYILQYIKSNFPKAVGRIKKSNLSSIRVFDKVGIPYTIL